MVVCECACATLISKEKFNLINRTYLFICLHIKFQIPFQNSKGQKSYRKFLGVRSELLLSIWLYHMGTDIPYHLGGLTKTLSFGINYNITNLVVNLAYLLHPNYGLVNIFWHTMKYSQRCKWPNDDCTANNESSSGKCELLHPGTNPDAPWGSSMWQPCLSGFYYDGRLKCGLDRVCCSGHWGNVFRF